MGRPSLLAAPIAVAAGLLALLAGGCGSDDAAGSGQARAAIERYRSSLEESSATLVSKVELLVAPVQTGKILRGQSFYAIARVPYGQVEQQAEAFGGLDARINASPGEVPAPELGGFHRVEKALWSEGRTEAVVPVAKRLLADVEELQRRVKTADLRETRIAEDAVELLREVSRSKLTGREERYGDADMVVVSANVEGAEAAFDAVKPLVAEGDSELAQEVEAGFESVYRVLKESFGLPAHEPEQSRASAPGVSFRPYSELFPPELRRLDMRIDALIELLSQASAEVAESQTG